MNIDCRRTWLRCSLLLVLTGCSVSLPPMRPALYVGAIKPIPASAPVLVGGGELVSSTFETVHSSRFSQPLTTHPVLTIKVVSTGSRHVVEQPWGYEVRASITDASMTSDPQLDAENERKLAEIISKLRDFEMSMRLDRERRPLPDSLRVTGPSLSGDGTRVFPDSSKDMFTRLMKQSALFSGRRLATGDGAAAFSLSLAGGRNVSLREVVEGRVTHAGRPAVLLRIEADLPADIPFAIAGYSVVDQATGLPLLSEVSTATVENGMRIDTLQTSRYTIPPPD